MKFTSLAILALLGDEAAVATAMRVQRGELQTPDYYDRSFDNKEAKEMQKVEMNVNKWDGLVHAQNGKVYDPKSMKEVALETTDVQLNEEKRDWCDSGIKGTDWCAQEETKDLNERTKRQQGLMFVQRQQKDWCDRGIHSDKWCDEEVKRGESEKTVDDKSLYEGPTKAAWQISGESPPIHDWQEPYTLAQQRKQKKDWCDSGIKGTDWCAQEETKDLNERTKRQQGLMFVQRQQKDWCDRGIHSDEWCDNEVTRGESEKTVDDKSLYEGPTKAAWQLDGSGPPIHDWQEPYTLAQQRKRDWCDSGIKGTDWCAQEETKDLNERTKRQQGLMFVQRQQKDWCDRGIHSDKWCDDEVTRGESEKTVDDKSLYEGPTKAAWQIDGTNPPIHDWQQPYTLSQEAPHSLANRRDWCDSGIKGTNWCAGEEAADLNERTKQQKGLMFTQRDHNDATAAEKKDWCDRGIKTDQWCDKEVDAGTNVKTVDDKSLYEGPTKAAWQIAGSGVSAPVVDN